MSALGDPYRFDVFFSYGWANDTGDANLREWCRFIAGNIRTMLAQRFSGGEGIFCDYLDRDSAKSGEDTAKELEGAAKGSAILVVMMSDYYRSSNYCLNEMNWFCDRIAADGGSIADHVCILRVQGLADVHWPARFKTPNGNPLTYIDFCDSQGQSLDMAHFLCKTSLNRLPSQIETAVLEIGDKMLSLDGKLRARRQYLQSQVPPDSLLFFLEAEIQDRLRWMECTDHLKRVPSIILPVRNPRPATEVASEREYEGCHGLLMLRSRDGDNFSIRIKKAYLHRRAIYLQTKQTIPWALLDDLDVPPPEQEAFSIPRIHLEGDWLARLRQALQNM